MNHHLKTNLYNCFLFDFFCDFYATDCNMKPKKEVTIYDIALKLDLSSATVSRALKNHPAINKNTKKKIQDAAKELGIVTIHLQVIFVNKKQIRSV